MEVDVPAGLVRTCDLRAVTPSYAMDVEEEKKREDVKCGNLLVISSSIPLPPSCMYAMSGQGMSPLMPPMAIAQKRFHGALKIKNTVQYQIIPSLSIFDFFRGILLGSLA